MCIDFIPRDKRDRVKPLAKGNTSRKIAVAVTTAGNHRTVNKHAYLISQSVAEALLLLYLAVHIGPIELFAPFEEDVRAELCARAYRHPRLWEMLLHQLEYLFVLFVQRALGSAVQIPKTQDNENILIRRFYCKIKASVYVAFKGHTGGICFKCVQGNAYLVRFGGYYFISSLRKKSAVCGDD